MRRGQSKLGLVSTPLQELQKLDCLLLMFLDVQVSIFQHLAHFIIRSVYKEILNIILIALAGICSTVGNAAVWGASAGTLEAKIAEYTAALKALEKVGDRAKANIVKFNTEMDSAREVLTEEIRLITDWEAAAEVVQNNIDSFSIEDLKAIAVFQQIFVDDIEVLQNTAQDYLDFTPPSNDEATEE